MFISSHLDDEPKDGPHHYIICSGFYSPNLFNYFDEFKIAPDGLMKFKSLNYELVRNFIGEIEDREKLETNMKINLKISSKSLLLRIAHIELKHYHLFYI